MSKIKVTIKGTCPLLQHRFSTPEEDPKWTKQTGLRDYSKEVLKALYADDEGKPYQPSDHILGALIKASTDFKIPGKGKKTYKDLIQSALFIYPDAIPHKIPKWVVDRRPVVIQRSRIIRERPRFDEWELSFEIDITDEQLPVDAVRKIIEHAGNRKGLGDFRPRFGRFMVSEFKELKE